MHLPGFAIDLIRLGVWLALIMAVFVPLERLFAARRQPVARPGFVIRHSLVFPQQSGAEIAAGAAGECGRLGSPPRHAEPVLCGNWRRCRSGCGCRPPWWSVKPAITGRTARCTAVPYLWRFHAIHHSAQDMDFLVNTRTHPIDSFFGRFCGLVPMYVLGLAQPMGNRMDLVPVLFRAGSADYGAFSCTANVSWRFGWLEYLVATPAFHHWHHTQ